MIRILFLLFVPLFAMAASPRGCTVASVLRDEGVVPTVVIDAGHGGHNLGAHFSQPFCEEKRLTLLTARALRKYLTQLGYRVVMTRSVDTFLSLSRRVELANRSHAQLCVSVHFNSSPTPSAQGVEIFWYDSGALHHKDRASAPPRPLRALAQRDKSSRHLASSVLRRVIRQTSAKSRGVKKANFYVLHHTQMPAILVEGGFLSNVQERMTLKDPLYLEKLARGIAEGVDYYFHHAS